MPSTPIASVDGLRYQACSSLDSASASLAMPWTRPCSSSMGLGCVNSETPTETTASATKAAIAPQNAAACGDPRLMMSQLSP